MSLPAVGSVWRKGDEELHVLHRTGIDVSFVRVQKDNSGWQSGCWKIDRWHAWAADAVQVWPPPETPQPVGETVRVRAAVAVENGPARRWFVSGWHNWRDESAKQAAIEGLDVGDWNIAFIEADIPLPPVPTIIASVANGDV